MTSSSKSSDDDNPEPVPERVRHSRGGGSTGIEEAAEESDDDGVFSDQAVLASINSASATLEATARAIAKLYSV